MMQFLNRHLPVSSSTARTTALNYLLLSMLSGLVACGGGGGGGSNSGQEPDPVVVDLPIAYIQRPIPLGENDEPVYPDVFDPDAFNPGGELYIKVRATTQAEVTNVTRAEFDNNLEKYPDYTPETPNYDVKDVSAHPAGGRLVFAMRAPLDPNMDEDEPEQPTWNIWEYHLESKLLRRVITSDFEAEKGHDVAPHYLPDGSILFTSNRQKRSKEILLDEGKPQFGATTQQDGDLTSFLLHTVSEDGADIQQLTYNQSHDIQPTVMPDGRLLFMRWQGTNPDRLSFYTANPDGTDVQRYFGYDSLNEEPGDDMEEAPRLFDPQVLPDGRIAAIYMQNTLQLGGDMVVVDGADAAEGEIASISIKPVDISTDLISLSGRFASLSPLYDGTNRLLVSWSQCRLQEVATERLQPCLNNFLVEGEPIEGYEEAPAFYGIWIYDITNQTQQPVVLAEAGKIFTEAIALEELAAPPAYIAPATDPDLAAQNVGLLHIRSVYDIDGAFDAMGSGVAGIEQMAMLPADQRPARFIRLLKAVSVPSNDVFNEQDDNIYGNLFNNNTGIMEILGYSPVEPDGSVMVTVPSDVAFNLEVLDVSGRRIVERVDQLISLRPGERRESNGLAILGREDLALPPLNAGAVNFANTARYDSLGAPIPPLMGQTMAEFAANSYYQLINVQGETVRFPDCSPSNLTCFLRKPTMDLDFTDEWMGTTTFEQRNKVNFQWSYNGLIPTAESDSIPAPTPASCRSEAGWNANCRVVINYEYHIQPLWERERAALTEIDPLTLITTTSTTCAGCHTTSDMAGNANVRVPSGQLELVRTKVAANTPMRSYPQLTQGNQRQIRYLYEGALAANIPVCEFEDLYPDEFIPQCEITLDLDGVPTCDGVANCPFVELDEETGQLELDALGSPIPRMVTTPFLPSPMNRNGANNSTRFFDRFAPRWDNVKAYKIGAIVFYDPVPGDEVMGWTFRARMDNAGAAPNPAVDQTTQWQRLRQRPLSDFVDHTQAPLNDAELKLLSEWLDTNGRYYTNPFEMAIPN